MSEILVDASISISWLLEDEVNATADWVLVQMQTGVRVYAPALWLWEITNALFVAERRKRVDQKYRDAALDRVERLPVTILSAPAISDLKALRALIERHRLTAYDAEYLRVAKARKLHLATDDKALIAAAKSEKVPLIEI